MNKITSNNISIPIVIEELLEQGHSLQDIRPILAELLWMDMPTVEKLRSHATVLSTLAKFLVDMDRIDHDRMQRYELIKFCAHG